jgi:hypothetical protein
MTTDNAESRSSGSQRPPAKGAAAVEGVHVVPPDYGMPGSKGIESPLKPLLWLLVPFFFCVIYGIVTR